MTYQANLEGAVQLEQLHSTAPSPVVDDAPHASKPPRQIGDYLAPVVGFAGFIGFYTLLLIAELYLMFKYARLGPSSLGTGNYHFETKSLSVNKS